MPRQEEPVPWAATQAAAREPYPRKNIYFAGPLMDEVYDYCVWQAHVNGHQTLRGRRARGVSEFAADILARAYFRAMLDSRTAKEFSEWRTATRESNGEEVRGQPPLQFLAFTEGQVTVPAAAGSGKTELIIAHMLAQLLRRRKRRKRQAHSESK